MSDEPTRAQPDRLDQILSEIGRLGANLTGLRTEVTGLSAEVTGLGADLTGLRTEVTGLRTEVTGLGADLTGLRTEVTGLRTGVTGLRVDLMDRMDRLQNALTEIRDDIGVNMARADAAARPPCQ